MKYLVYNSCSLAHPHFGVQLENAERLFQEGNEVIFSYCDGIMDTCFMNPEANIGICKLCKLGYDQTLSKLSKGIKILPLNKKTDVNYSFEYNTVEDIKAIKYKEVNVGIGVISTYISLTRNPKPCITDQSKEYFNYILNDMFQFCDSVHEIIDKYNPDGISIYNGRFYENRPFYDMAIHFNLEITSNEIAGGDFCGEPFYLTSFKNSLPSGLKELYNQTIFTWNSSKEKKEQKISKGESFFQKRRNGVPAGDRVYISKQIKGKLPSVWDKSKKNFVIFNSSEDEFAGLGGDFDQFSLFKTQLEGIRFMLTSIKNENIHFYLRIHPNLSKVLFSYHTDIYLFENEFSNITIIRPNEDVSTYDLLDAAERVIVFGSTMGVEAAFWGKPVILLAGAMYYFLDCCYIPKTPQELLVLLNTDILKAKDRTDAIKFGYYVLDREIIPSKSKYFDINFKTFYLLGFKINSLAYMTLFGSDKLFKIIMIFWLRLVRLINLNNVKMPDKIFKD